MTVGAGLAGALLLLAGQTPGTLPPESPQTAPAQRRFAPPMDQPMEYRVTTRRLGRDGSLLSFSLIYGLRWQRAGRGYQLVATLQHIDSDANPAIVRAVTLALQPLIGEPMTYLVAPDGSRIDLVDPDGLWQRATARTEALGAGAGRAEAKQMAAMLAALPAEEREELAAADIRALVAPANAEIPAAKGGGVSISQDGALRTIARVEHEDLPIGDDSQPLQVDTLWTIDTAAGLVVREQRQSWIAEPGTDARTLVEERVRALQPAGE